MSLSADDQNDLIELQKRAVTEIEANILTDTDRQEKGHFACNTYLISEQYRSE